MEDTSFSSLVAKLNEMSDTTDTKERTKPIKVIKKAQHEKKSGAISNDPNVNAMASLLESIDESKPNHLKGKEKSKSVPAGETDGTTKNTNRGKLVGEENTLVDEDLIASLSSQFRDLIKPQTAVAEEEPTPEAVGEFAEPIYALCDELECPDNHPVFDDLVRYLSGDQINDFVDDFRRNHDMPEGGTDEGIAATIGQGIDSAVAGAGKMAVKGLKKGVKKLSKLGSKNTSTSFDGKGGSKTTTAYNEDGVE